MSDELVERLLDWPYQGETMAHEAADRIKQLTAERDRLRAALLAEAGRRIARGSLGFGNDFADQVQAALKGESHE